MKTFVCFCVCFAAIVCRCQTIKFGEHISNPLYLKTESEVEMSRHKYGSDVRLKCPINPNVITDTNSSLKISWDFKECDIINGVENCYRKKLNTKSRRTLEIRNISSRNSGEYRCFEDDFLRKTFVVHVVADLNGGMPPHVISMKATNLTIPEDGGTILQCRIKSIESPYVVWFRDCYGRGCTSIKIYEHSSCYCLISVVHPVPVGRYEYLSKLKISEASQVDTGLYTCFAWSLYGFDNRNISIKVFDTLEREHLSTLWLFLVPLLFFLIPVSAWLCYYRNKKPIVENNNIINEQQKKLMQPELQFYEVSERIITV